MLYYANDLVVSKTGKFYRIIARDPTRSTRQRTLYRVRRLSDGREMAKAYQPFVDFWRAPQAAEAALDAGDVAGATRAALVAEYPVDAAAEAEGADEVEVEVEAEEETEAEDEEVEVEAAAEAAAQAAAEAEAADEEAAAEEAAEAQAEAEAEAEAQAAAEDAEMARRGRKWKAKQGPCTYTGGVPKRRIWRRTRRYATEARDDGAREEDAREEDAREAPAEKPKKQEKPKKPKKSKSPMAATTTEAEAGSPPPSSLIKRARAPPGAPVRPTAEATSATAGLTKNQRKRRAKRERERARRALPAWLRECPEGCVWEAVPGHAPAAETEPGPWAEDSQGERRPMGDFLC